MKKTALLLGILIFISGCTSLSGITGGKTGETTQIIKGKYGLALNSFTSERNTLKSGEITTVRLKLTNIGNRTAGNISVQLINLGILQTEGSDRYTLEEMEHRDSEEFEWEVKAPKVSGVQYNPIAKICYDIDSVGYITLKAVDNEIYSTYTRVLDIVADTTEGPVSISFETDNPIVINEGGDTEELRINLVNADEGQVSTAYGSETFGELNFIDEGSVKVIVPRFNGRLAGLKSTCAIGTLTPDSKCRINANEYCSPQLSCYTHSELGCTPKKICYDITTETAIILDETKDEDVVLRSLENPDYTCIDVTNKQCRPTNSCSIGAYDEASKTCLIDADVILESDSGAYWQCENSEDNKNIECYNTQRIRFINGERARLRINAPVERLSEGQTPLDETVTFEVIANYKYCYTTNPITISIQ